MTARIGHWAQSRLAEHRAISEYRHAWRRLRRLRSAAPTESDPDDSRATGPFILEKVLIDQRIKDQEENQ